MSLAHAAELKKLREELAMLKGRVEALEAKRKPGRPKAETKAA